MPYIVPEGRTIRLASGQPLHENTILSEETEKVFGPERIQRFVQAYVPIAERAKSDLPPPSFGKWTRNPERLEGLSLEKLNMLIREADPDMPEFESEEEAKAQLTLDWVPGMP